MNKILALDLGTNTGFCCGTPEHHISGVWRLKIDRFSDWKQRLVRLRGHLNECHNAYAFEHVVVEEVRRHAGTDAAHLYGALLGTVEVWCHDHNNIPHSAIPVGTIKKFATGKGNASKDAMISAVAERWGLITDDDNEADAFALFMYQCENTIT